MSSWASVAKIAGGNATPPPSTQPPAPQPSGAWTSVSQAAGNPSAPAQNQISIGPAAPAFSAGQVLKDTAELPVNPLGAVSDEWNSLRQLVRSSATNHPEFSKVVGDKMDALQEMLFGGQSVGKPMGTSGGVANVAMALGVPEAGSEMAGIEGAKAGETFVGKAGDAHVLVGKGGKILAGILRDPETNEITITPTKILNRVIPDNPEYAAKEAAAEREEQFNERAEALMHRGEEQ